MSRFRNAIPLGLIIVPILVGSGYWCNQQRQLESFVKQLESLNVNQGNTVEPKDYAALRRDLIILQNTLNGSVFQLVGSLFFLVTAYTAWLNFIASEKKQVSERFAKAIDQLGSNELGVRVGGIFALEQIAQTSLNEHWVVMEVLTSYIRDQSLKGQSIFKPSVEKEVQPDESGIQAVLKRIRAELSKSVTTDIQAALTVISRRNSSQDPKGKVIDLSFCDIRCADLKNAKLNNADLRGTKLSGADLSGANLQGANLQGANLELTVLNDAILTEAKLNDAKLDSAYLEQANLQDADLTNAHLKAANLQGAKLNRSTLHFVVLTNAKLQCADFSQSQLSHVDLRDAVIDNETKLDQKWKLIHDIRTNGAKNRLLDGFDFSEALLVSANFEGTSLKNTNFNGADLSGANFKNSHLDGASFIKTILIEVTFEDANLSSAIFQDTNLSSATLQDTLLEKVKFTRSTLQDVNFHLANLSEAEFNHCSYSKETNFQQANLTKAVFTGPLVSADFRNSNHQEANFSTADVSSAQF